MELQQSLRQEHRLTMNMAMRHAFDVLMMPTIELSDWLEREIEKNPLLKLTKSCAQPFDSLVTCSDVTLYDYLSREIELHFQTPEEKEIARHFAGSLDDNGFLTLSSEELKGKEAILKKLQQIEPLGLGAQNVREALLIQLEDKRKEPAYQIVELHYEDLLHNRLRKVSKCLKLTLSEIKETIQKEIRPLNPFPGRQFISHFNPHLSPDVSIIKEGDIWSVEVNDSHLPTFEIETHYLETLQNPFAKREEIHFIRRHLAAGNWLTRITQRRQKTLHSISIYLLKTQRDYLEGIRNSPIPMTMKAMAEALNISESTVTRAISHKAIATPRGLIKLRDFFTHGIQSKEGKISNQAAKNLLEKWITEEKEPLPDAALSKKLERYGIRCARRTVAKYRRALKIGSASERKMRKL